MSGSNLFSRCKSRILKGQTGPILLLSAMSCVGIFSGLVEVSGGWSLNAWPRIMAGLCLAIAIQTMLVVSLRHLRSQYWHIAIGLYLVMAFFSVSFSQAFWSRATGLDRMNATAVFRNQARVLGQQIADVRQSYDQLQQISNNLKVRSQNLAQKESQQGGTCGGPESSFRGQGPRYHYRENDKDVLGDFADHFASQKAALDKSYARLMQAIQKHASTPSAFYKIADTVNAIVKDPEIKDYRVWLYQRNKEADQGMIRSGQYFKCPLPTISHAYQSVAQLDLQPIKNFHLVDTSEHGSDIIQAFKSTWSFLTLHFAALSQPQMVAIGFGVIIDVGILFFALLERQEREWDSLLDLPRESEAIALQLQSLLESPAGEHPGFGQIERLSRLRSGHYDVYLPKGKAKHDGFAQAWDIVRVFYAARMARHLGEAKGWTVPESIRSQFEASTRFDRFRLPARLVTKWALWSTGQPTVV